MSDPTPCSCAEAFEHLQNYLDRELSQEDIVSLEAHLATCEGCAGAYKFEENMLKCVRAKVQATKLPDGLATRILNAIDTTSKE